MRPSSSLRLLFLASLLLVASSLPRPPPSPTTTMSRPSLPDEAPLARLCDPQRALPAMPLSLCHELHLRRRGGTRHHHRPLPPPGRGGEEEVDMRYGVAKRLVPSGPNPLHN